MIGTISIKCNAAHPELALPAVYAYVESPSSIRILDVPKKIGKWQITSVTITFVYPDGDIVSAECVLTGGVWVGTLHGNSTSGTSENGVTIFASGVDENGLEIRDYVLGKGDLNILEADGGLRPFPSMQYVKLLSVAATEPKTGDLFPISGDYYIYQNGQANPIGITHSELNNVQATANNALDKATEAITSANQANTKAISALDNAANAQATAEQALNALSSYATTQYVDDIVGDINTILEGLN